MNIADILIYIAGILWMIEAIPQIYKLIKTKETSGISMFFFGLCASAYTLFLIGNIMLKQWSVVIAHIVPFLNVLTIIILVKIYGQEEITKDTKTMIESNENDRI